MMEDLGEVRCGGNVGLWRDAIDMVYTRDLSGPSEYCSFLALIKTLTGV